MSAVRIRKNGAVGHITLTRPKAMNALTHGMALLMERALDDWALDPSVEYVVVDAEGDRAFCAGGDLLSLYQAGQAGDYACAADFWRDEYRLNQKIATYPKPYTALMHGVVMGGGVGISAHGSHRIVTDNTMIAMPECSVGLIPDVGGSLILANAPGHVGTYLGLTGERMGPGDAIFAGFADTYVPSEKWHNLSNALKGGAGLEAIADCAAGPPEGNLPARQSKIDEAFDCETPSDAISALEQLNEDWSVKAASKIKAASPLCVAAAWNTILTARQNNNLAYALQAEFRFTSRGLEHGDFLEGIRAAVIDKDRSPKWTHATLSDVPAELLALMAEPAEGGDVTFGTTGEDV
ncbi:MAG: enoyl-CoA hydratase/isomerase family protein [Pseudomonadota bacterium]